MRHLKSGRKLNRTASHRKAMFSNMAASLIEHERIKTTLPKAKELRSVVERLITHGKKGTLHSVRTIEKVIKNKDLIRKITADIAPGYKDRNGGYTRILKLGERKNDRAEMAIIELVGRTQEVPESTEE
ncbi:MAG: 50S ribosomal protein L17 [Fibrobacterota bacterium]